MLGGQSVFPRFSQRCGAADSMRFMRGQVSCLRSSDPLLRTNEPEYPGYNYWDQYTTLSCCPAYSLEMNRSRHDVECQSHLLTSLRCHVSFVASCEVRG